MTRRSRAVVLCEDRAHWHFIRAYLKERGWNERHLTPRISPIGAGAAEQWVREKYPEELKTYRAKAQENTCLIVMIDGDKKGAMRLEELQESAQSLDVVDRTQEERVAVFVPNRNLESRFAWLDGEFTNEDENVKNRYRQGVSRKAYAKSLASRCMMDGDFDNAPPSLRQACIEWGRISGPRER